VDFFCRGPQRLAELKSNEIPGVRARSGLAELPPLLQENAGLLQDLQGKSTVCSLCTPYNRL